MWEGLVDWWTSVKEKRVAEEEASQDASLSTNGRRNLAAPAPPKASGYLKKLERRADKTYQWALRHVELKPAQQLLSYAENPDATPLALLPLAMLTHVRSAGECDIIIGSRTETIRLRAPSAGAQKVWVRALSRALASVHSVRTSSARSTNSLTITETLDAEAVSASPGEPFPEKGGAPEVVDEQPSSPADRWRRARSAPSVTAPGARLRTPLRTPPSKERSPNAADVPARAAATSPSPLSATAVPAKSPSPRRTDVPVDAPAIVMSPPPAASRAESHDWHLRGQSDAAAEPSSPTVATACDASSAPDLLDPSEKGSPASPILAELELAPTPPPTGAVADNGATADDGDAVGNGGAAANNGDAAANDGAAAIKDEATSNDEITTATDVASPLPLHPAAAYLGTSETSRTELLYRYGTERKREKAASGPRTLDLDMFDYDNHAGIARGRDSYLHSGRPASDASAERELARATFSPTLSARSEQLASSSSSRAHGGPWWERQYKTAKTDDDIEELRRRVDQETGVTHSPIISPLAASLRRPGRVEERLFSEWHEVQQWREEQFESREKAVDRAAQEARRGRLERLNGRISSTTSDSPAYLRLFELAAAGKSPRPATASPPRGHGSSEKQARSSGNLSARRSAASSRSNDTPAIFERLHDLALEEQAKRRRAERDEAACPRRVTSSPGKAATSSGKASPRAQVAGASVDDSPCKRLYEDALEQRSRKSERVRQSQVEQERELASHPLRAAKASAADIGAAVGKMHAQAVTQISVREARAKQSRQALDQEAAAQVYKTAGRSPIKGKLLTRLHEVGQQQRERLSQRVLEIEQERRAHEANLPFAPVITKRGKSVEGRAMPKTPSPSPTKAAVTQRM